MTTSAVSENGSHPEEVARGFVAALDAGRWRDAAAFVAPSTVDAFRQGWLAWLRAEASLPRGRPIPRSDTVFSSPLSLLQLRSVDEAERLSPIDLLARFIERMQPENFEHAAGPDSRRALRPVRTVIGIARPGAESAVAEYRVAWGGVNHPAPGAGAIHRMHLGMTPEGWRVTDADVAGHGNGHLLPLMDYRSPEDPFGEG
jgi:hypothetical protein